MLKRTSFSGIEQIRNFRFRTAIIPLTINRVCKINFLIGAGIGAFSSSLCILIIEDLLDLKHNFDFIMKNDDLNQYIINDNDVTKNDTL